MGAVKRMAEDVAERMEINDISDPRVLSEVNRRLSITKRRVAVIASHPNGGPLYIDKMGDEDEVWRFLKEMEAKDFLDYVNSILVLAEQGEDEVCDWLYFEDGSPSGVKSGPPHHLTNGTPPLPGLEARLARIEAEAYGQKHSVWSILQSMSDEEITLAFSDVLESCLQEGRTLVIPEVECQQ